MEIDTIKRVARGRASREERREVERWAAESADRQRFLRDARGITGVWPGEGDACCTG